MDLSRSTPPVTQVRFCGLIRNLVIFYDKQGLLITYRIPDPHGKLFKKNYKQNLHLPILDSI